ncbi:MAG TPA: Yip1 family protein [Methanoregula sp.]|nr:Yip1 family protein [Methanoregula sp.]
MFNTIAEKVRGFLLEPVETFGKSRTDEPGALLAYFVALLLINAVFSAIVTAAFVSLVPFPAGFATGVPLPALVFFAVLAGGFILTLVFAAWVHLWVYIFGGRKGIMQTAAAIIYGQTPRLLLGWIPFIGFLFLLWSLVLNILGIRELQELSTMKAILVMAVAVLIPLILIILLAAYLLVGSAGVTSVRHVVAVPALHL